MTASLSVGRDSGTGGHFVRPLTSSRPWRGWLLLVRFEFRQGPDNNILPVRAVTRKPVRGLPGQTAAALVAFRKASLQPLATRVYPAKVRPPTHPTARAIRAHPARFRGESPAPGAAQSAEPQSNSFGSWLFSVMMVKYPKKAQDQTMAPKRITDIFRPAPRMRLFIHSSSTE